VLDLCTAKSVELTPADSYTVARQEQPVPVPVLGPAANSMSPMLQLRQPPASQLKNRTVLSELKTVRLPDIDI